MNQQMYVSCFEKISFYSVYPLVRGKHIGFCVHLGVHRDECIVRSVAVHQKVVDAEYAVVSRDFGFQLGNELFVGCNPD